MTPPDLVKIINHKQDEMPLGLKDGENLNPLFNSLPPCPFLLVNRLGAILADRRPANEDHRAKKNDLDLMVPVSCCDQDTWEEILKLSPETISTWGDQDAMVTPDNMYFILNPRHNSMSTAEKQRLVCRLLGSQTTDTEDVIIHQISTGESIVKVNSQSDSSPHAEIFPLILEPGQDQAQVMVNMGYLPDHGMVAISPSQFIYQVNVSSNPRQEFNPDLSAYAYQSPHHAIMFLRRLVKSTLNSVRSQDHSSQKARRIEEFNFYYQKLMEEVISPAELDDKARSSLSSLNKKIKKISKFQIS